MGEIVVKFFILLCVSAVVVGLNENCPQGWLYYQDSCYGYGDQNVTWLDAQEWCELYGGKLAEIESEGENTFLKTLARNKKASSVWLGGTDTFSEGYWEWVKTKAPILEFTDWSPGEPNQRGDLEGEDCLDLFKEANYQWNDAPCKFLANFVCEALPEEAIVG